MDVAVPGEYAGEGLVNRRQGRVEVLDGGGQVLESPGGDVDVALGPEIAIEVDRSGAGVAGAPANPKRIGKANTDPTDRMSVVTRPRSSRKKWKSWMSAWPSMIGPE